MKCGHGNSPDKCIYPKCLKDDTCGKERPDDEGVTAEKVVWDDTKGNIREIIVPKGTTL